MNIPMIRRVPSALVVVAAAAISVVVASGGADAMPLPVGITSSDTDRVVTAQSIERSRTDYLACLTTACVVPVGTLTEGHLYRLHLVPAGVGRVGFVAVIDGQLIVADGVDRLETPTFRWSGLPLGIGFTEP